MNTTAPTYGPDLIAEATRLPGLSLRLMTDTTTATAYLRGFPFCTVQRRGRFSGEVRAWAAYDLNGTLLATDHTARGIVRKVTGAAAWTLALAPLELAACTVELAPDYNPRPLALGIVPHVGGARRGYTLAGVEPGHVFMRLSYLGNPPPTFRRRADLAEWLALVGLVEGERVECVGGAA